MKDALKGWGERKRQTDRQWARSPARVIWNLTLRVETIAYSLACPFSLVVLGFGRSLD